MENTFHHQLTAQPIGRRLITSGVFIVIAIVIALLFLNNLPGGLTTTFELNPGGSKSILPATVVSSSGLITFFMIAIFVFSGIQLVLSIGKVRTILGVWANRWTGFAVAFVVTFFLMAFLTWAAAGKSLNLAGLLVTTIVKSVPITLAALAGILCERAGIFNIGIEGMMLSGAMVSALMASITNSLWIGMFMGILAGAMMGALHAVLSIKYKINQIISGTVINILATGLTSYISSKFLQVYENLNSAGVFPTIRIPILVDIPFIGPILFNNNIYVYAMFFFIILMTIMLFKTRAGLRMRSVGEHPKAADTLGINVIKTRYLYVLLSGMMAGFAGSYFTIGSVGRFDQIMTGGRGFIGLAAMIFGNYMPVGSMGAGMLFGFFDSLKDRLSILDVKIPSYFLLMAPYIATMIVLAGVVGKSSPPAAGGQPYEKE